MTKQLYYAGWDGYICDDIYLSRKKTVIMAGPCMLETRDLAFTVGRFLKEKCQRLNLPYIFKTSYDKANRTSANSMRGPGLNQAIEWLQELKKELQVPILIDVHTPEQAVQVGEIADIIQMPAFLCQQKQLLAAAASTKKVIQIKKGQWLTSEEMIDIANFIIHKCNNPRVILVERGTNFGYNNLVVDFRNLVKMHQFGHAVVFDATHCVQLPGANDGRSGGMREMVPYLSAAALAIGIDGIFMEVHTNPVQAWSDADTQLSLDMAEDILENIVKKI